MILSSRILGAGVARELGLRAAAPLLVIGSDRFTRADLSGVGCFNFIAAQRLAAAIVALHVRNTRHLFDEVPPSAFALPGLGAIAIAVLGACFERKGIGGDAPLESWVAHHQPKGAHLVSFLTIKHHDRDARAERAERTAAKQRKHARRGKAHRLRVDRFTARQEKGRLEHGKA